MARVEAPRPALSERTVQALGQGEKPKTSGDEPRHGGVRMTTVGRLLIRNGKLMARLRSAVQVWRNAMRSSACWKRLMLRWTCWTTDRAASARTTRNSWIGAGRRELSASLPKATGTARRCNMARGAMSRHRHRSEQALFGHASARVCVGSFG
jgi:hypothetical protein